MVEPSLLFLWILLSWIHYQAAAVKYVGKDRSFCVSGPGENRTQNCILYCQTHYISLCPRHATYNMTYMVTDVTNEFQSHLSLSLASIMLKLPSLIHTEAEAERDGGTARKKKKKGGHQGVRLQCEIRV